MLVNQSAARAAGFSPVGKDAVPVLAAAEAAPNVVACGGRAIVPIAGEQSPQIAVGMATADARNAGRPGKNGGKSTARPRRSDRSRTALAGLTLIVVQAATPTAKAASGGSAPIASHKIETDAGPLRSSRQPPLLIVQHNASRATSTTRLSGSTRSITRSPASGCLMATLYHIHHALEIRPNKQESSNYKTEQNQITYTETP